MQQRIRLRVREAPGSKGTGAYQHVGEFFQGFEDMVAEAFQNADAPTDPMIVVQTFDELIDLAPSTRPLRTLVGLDFGLQALNDVTDPIRRQTLESMRIEGWDGARN